MNKTLGSISILSLVAILSMSGCSKMQKMTDNSNMEAENKIAHLEKQIEERDRKISSLEESSKRAMATQRSMSTSTSMSGNSIIPDAQPGHCYGKVMVPAKYETKQIRKLARESSTKIDVIPATYKTVNKVVTVKDESTRIVTIPATYKTVRERVLVKPETKKLIPVGATYKTVKERVLVEPEKVSTVTIPATYRTVSERILVKKAHTTWKKGRGSIEKVDNMTGDIMCLVEVPAVYKTITKKVVDRPASTREVVTPAVYKTITKRVVDTPASTREVVVPAVYKTITKKVVDRPESTREVVIPAKTKVIKTRVLATPSRKIEKEIPATYKMVTVRTKVSEPYVRWQEVLCETNTTPNVVLKVQKALKARNYNITKLDGRYGEETARAVRAYQKKMNIAQGALTIKTLRSLGVQ